MMYTTHILIGMLIGSSAKFWAPEFVFYAVIGGIFGALIPDLDIKLVHRKTLHMPVYYSILAVLVCSTLLISVNTFNLFLSSMSISLAVHSVGDVFSGGLAPQEEKKIAKYPIYDHLRNKWISKPVIRYDGSPEDTFISLVSGLATIQLLTGYIRYLAVLMILLSLIYYTFRRRFHLYFLSNNVMNLEEDEIEIITEVS